MNNQIDTPVTALPFGHYSPTGGVKLFLFLSSNMSFASGWFRSLLKRYVRAGLGQKSIDVHRFQSNLRLHFDNICEMKVLLTPASFDQKEREFLASHLKEPGSVFLDIGANAGLYSVYMLSVSDQIDVLCVEPNPTMISRLKANLKVNNDFEKNGSKVHIAECALGDTDGFAELSVSDMNLGESTLAAVRSTEIKTSQSIKVQVRPLDKLLETQGITKVDALKIDVEGYEPNVLIPFFRDADPALFPRSIVMEMVHESEESAALSSILAERGYKEVARTKLNSMLTNY